MESRNVLATIVVLVLFAIIGYVVLTRTNILGRLRRPVATATPAPLDRTIDSNVNLNASASPFPLLFPTSTPSGSLRPLATASASPVAQCTNLSATPANGTAPLTVRLSAIGLPASIAQYEFDFGTTASNDVIRTANTTATFTYDTAGTYNASLKAFDAQGTQITSLQNCFRTVTVLARPGATGASNGSNLPKTGPEALLLALLAPLGGAGVYLYRKFKLV